MQPQKPVVKLLLLLLAILLINFEWTFNSLYLVHVLVIMLSTRYLSALLPLEVMVVLPIVLVLPVASQSYRYITDQ